MASAMDWVSPEEKAKAWTKNEMGLPVHHIFFKLLRPWNSLSPKLQKELRSQVRNRREVLGPNSITVKDSNGDDIFWKVHGSKNLGIKIAVGVIGLVMIAGFFLSKR